MDQPTPDSFLDVQRLLQSSLPRPRAGWLWYATIGFCIALATSTLVSGRNGSFQAALSVFSGLAMLAVVIFVSIFTSRAVKLQRQEQQRVEAIEELVQLRRWDQAASMLDALLSQPTRVPGARLQSLIYLATVLARYHRFADAIAVQGYLMEHAEFDPGTTHGLKLMRAMSLLHEDQLVDADRALADLRREAPDSAGLTLIEMYRDVKTGHPEEAIDLFNSRSSALRSQLGNRVADAYALLARAHDLLGQDALAAAAFEKATLLADAEEIYRRYPEVAAIRGKYPAASAPREAA